MPTFAKLAGTTMPQDRKTDGIEAWDYISGTSDVSPRKTFVLANDVIRHEKWKLFLPGQYVETIQRDCFESESEWREAVKAMGSPVKYEMSRLYDIESDVGESNDLSGRYPEVVSDLEKRLKDFNQSVKAESRPIGYWDGQE